ncbi:MAG: 3'-5' exonuclease [Psychrobium sp.]|nr:3'-5' exonuclease [Psychrobium sp.]
MKTILFFDTETTGLPVWKEPSGGDNQPHLVQLAAILANAETREEIASMDVIIKPDGWEIPKVTSDIHGITNEYANSVGITEKLALDVFLDLQKGADRVSYNRTFDQRIIRIAAKRYSNEIMVAEWANKDNYHCAMLAAKPIVKCPAKTPGKIKTPKLQDAYKYFFADEFDGAHSALADTRACMKVYWATLDALSTQAVV